MIEYKGEPLSGLWPLPQSNLWVYVPLWYVKDMSSQEWRILMRDWYKLGEEPAPVLLAFTIESTPASEHVLIPLLNPFPLPQIGEYGLVDTSEDETLIYHIQQLPLEARQRWVALGDMLRKLSEPLLWPPYTDWTNTASDKTTYQNALHSLAQQQELTIKGSEAFTSFFIRAAMLQAAHEHVKELRTMLQKEFLAPQWEEVRRMANTLAHDYYIYHEKTQRGHIIPLPALTSQHQTIMPSGNHTRALAQSFGPYVTRSLWNTEDSVEQQLRTPNGATLAARGENEHEQRALHTFIDGGMGVEGIKYMVSLLAAYHAQTGAINRKNDARVTLRQLLMYMGYGENHADNLEEQRKLMHYILYLSRTWVTTTEKIAAPTGRGRRKESYREYSPLIVLEALSSDVRGGIRIPDAIEFHLGKEFWEQMFGKHQHFFTIPTALILGYHSKNQKQEICLALYLANMLNLNNGVFHIHFPELLIQTGLQGRNELEQSINRTRDALANIYALERLEKDKLVERNAHHDIDSVLAVELYSNANRKEDISEATLTRIYNSYRHYQALSSTELKARKRIALQHLLDTVESNAIKFRSGPLINIQIEKRTQGIQLAVERREQARKAALSRKQRGTNVD